MCIIAVKTMNNKFMSKATLEECFRNNPDGAGFMWADKGMVHIRKGFMSFSTFWKALTDVRTEYGDMIPYVMHFRISTQAGIQQSCTHPFPLSTTMKDLKMLSCKAKVGIAHNGIIQLTTDHNQKEYSDTMKFITDYVPFFIKNLNWWKNEHAKIALKELCGSKLAILGGDNHIELIGDFVKDKGNYFSNTTFKAPKYKNNWFQGATVSHSLYDDGYYCGSWADDWGAFWNESTQKYEFDESYCPMSIDDCESYCEACCDKEHCSLHKNLVQEKEKELELKVGECLKKRVSERASASKKSSKNKK